MPLFQPTHPLLPAFPSSPRASATPASLKHMPTEPCTWLAAPRKGLRLTRAHWGEASSPTLCLQGRGQRWTQALPPDHAADLPLWVCYREELGNPNYLSAEYDVLVKWWNLTTGIQYGWQKGPHIAGARQANLSKAFPSTADTPVLGTFTRRHQGTVEMVNTVVQGQGGEGSQSQSRHTSHCLGNTAWDSETHWIYTCRGPGSSVIASILPPSTLCRCAPVCPVCACILRCGRRNQKSLLLPLTSTVLWWEKQWQHFKSWWLLKLKSVCFHSFWYISL